MLKRAKLSLTNKRPDAKSVVFGREPLVSIPSGDSHGVPYLFYSKPQVKFIKEK